MLYIYKFSLKIHKTEKHKKGKQKKKEIKSPSLLIIGLIEIEASLANKRKNLVILHASGHKNSSFLGQILQNTRRYLIKQSSPEFIMKKPLEIHFLCLNFLLLYYTFFTVLQEFVWGVHCVLFEYLL